MKIAFTNFLLTAAKLNTFGVSNLSLSSFGGSSSSTSLPATMKTYNLYEAGPASNMKLEEVDTPTIKDDEVLIKTKAISVNPVDFKVRKIGEMIPVLCGTEELPVVLGWDVAGVVAKVGPKVTSFQAGDKVFGMVNFPGHGKVYASYVAAPASQLAKMGDSQSFEDAAATTLAALTPYQAMKSRVKKGDIVFIHAGSGGVGHFAIQIAKALGAGKVITTSSAKNKEFCMQMGADEHIDYRSCKFEDVASDVDFVLDSMGGDNLVRSLKILKDGGSLVTLPSADDITDEVKKHAEAHNLTVEWMLVKSNGGDMSALSDMIKKGQLKAHVSETFDFNEMAKAHEQLESGHTVGKAVVINNDQ